MPLHFAVDVTDEAAVRDMAKQVLQHFGRIDVLVCTAAAWRAAGWKKLRPPTYADFSKLTRWELFFVASRRD